VPGAADDILRTLEAFALTWDGAIEWQSRRKPLYEEALGRLRSAGLAYRCRCSRKEVADSALRGIEGAVYPGTCRKLGLAAGVPGADRFLVADGLVGLDDRVQGRIAQDVAREVGDFVLKRRDGLHAYQLAVVVDDAQQAITDVVRGADLLHSTPRQVLLQRALGYPTPRYLHFPVATDAAGDKLSKQTLARAVDPSRAATLIAAALSFLGQPPVDSRSPAEMLAQAAGQWHVGGIPKSVSARAPGV
jgi:glutamyl-Q tRNA(Asp) synthetase